MLYVSNEDVPLAADLLAVGLRTVGVFRQVMPADHADENAPAAEKAAGGETGNGGGNSSSPGAGSTADEAGPRKMLTAAAEALRKNPGLPPGLYRLEGGELKQVKEGFFDAAYFGKIDSDAPVPQFVSAPENEAFSVRFLR